MSNRKPRSRSSLILPLAASLLSVAAAQDQVIDLRVVDETAPAGGLAIVLVELTEPKPISKGQLRFVYDGGVLGEVARATAFDTGILQSSFAFGAQNALVMFDSAASTFGTSPLLPILVLAIPVSPSAIPGQTETIAIDLSDSSFLDPFGAPYLKEIKVGTFTVGGFSMTGMEPASGNIPAGGIIRLEGVGFQPGVDVNIAGADIDSVQFVNSGELSVMLERAFEIAPTTRIRLRNPDDSEEIAYPALFAVDVEPPPPPPPPENDIDGDGVLNDVEDGAPNGGDGNRDGTPDREQAQVASLPDSASGAYATLVVTGSGEPVLSQVRSSTNPSAPDTPVGVTFPIGFFEFEIAGVTPGGTVQVRLQSDVLPGDGDYYKFGPTPERQENHWHLFEWDGASGSRSEEGDLVLTFVDGARGDDDLTTNGRIVDPGGAAVIAPQLIFPQYVDGDGNSSRIVLAAGAAPSRLLVRFRSFVQGVEVASHVTIDGEPSAEREINVPAFGIVDLRTNGSGALETGSVEIIPLEPDAPAVSGTLIFSVLGDYVSVQSAAPADKHQIFITRTAAENAGLAIFNPDPDRSATLRMTLLDSDGPSGATLETRDIVLPPRTQLVAFVDEEQFFGDFFAAVGDFTGTVNIVSISGVSVAVVGLIQEFLEDGRAPLMAIRPSKRAFQP